jgi:HD domain-containing protein
MRLEDIQWPQTPAAIAAREVSTTYHTPALANHCARSYVWAAAYADLHGVPHDQELLYVAAMLHDLGLVREFDSHEVAFEYAGGHVAWVFGAGAGWPVPRRVRLREVIVRHMWDEVDVTADPEGHLLELATGLDVSGRNPDRWPAPLRDQVVAAIPRLSLPSEFVACFADQAARKPDSAAAAAVRSGMAERIEANVLDRS